jgi:putative phosphotransacetylase
MKTIKVPCSISARHVHLSHADYAAFVAKHGEVTKKRDLSQGLHWATHEKAQAYGLNFTIVMPPRDETAYELSLSEAISHDVPFQFGKGLFQIKQRHLHCPQNSADELDLKDGDTVSIQMDGSRAGRYDQVLVRVDRWASMLEVHLDTDEANALGIKNGNLVDLLLP